MCDSHLPMDDTAIQAALSEADRALLVSGEYAVVGIKEFAPGEVFANHYHESYDELFVGLSGEISIWVGRATEHVLRPGSTVSCIRGSHHRLENMGTAPARLMFVKSSPADDTVWVSWDPER